MLKIAEHSPQRVHRLIEKVSDTEVILQYVTTKWNVSIRRPLTDGVLGSFYIPTSVWYYSFKCPFFMDKNSLNNNDSKAHKPKFNRIN